MFKTAAAFAPRPHKVYPALAPHISNRPQPALARGASGREGLAMKTIGRVSRMVMLSPLLLLVAAPAERAAAQCAAPGLGGVWHGNDGGTYRLGVSGTRVSWEGHSGDNGKSWINRFRGTRSGSLITGDWADQKKPGGRGTMTIRVANDHLLVRTASKGSFFGGTRWTRKPPSHGCNDTVGNPANE